MRVAEIAPPWFTVPPQAYGGIELVVSFLADGLSARGHDVTLFAASGSESKADVLSSSGAPPDPALLGNIWIDTHHALHAYLHADEFDVVHDHSGIVGPALGAMLGGRPPIVHTLHGPWTESARRYYSLIHERVHLVAISNAQRADHPSLRYAATIHNGIDPPAYPFRDAKDDYLVYVGRANPDKGPTRAIEVARRAGLPLVMIVKKSEPFERSYWQESVVPMLTDDVEVFEGVSHDTKVDLISRARAMVFPIDWAEPFGLVMIEAMACGTPVVACPIGAASEVVADGVTGFLRQTLDELVEAVGMIERCDPHACRLRVEQHFTAEAMIDAYDALLSEVAAVA
jgi:glycosyltransferase involved in cell wall biosynthesis